LFFTFSKVTHRGSGWRISLSNDESDEEPCVLLDHIPHNDDPPNFPRIGDYSSYIPYVLTIEIPDLYCERCSLHLSNPMTDKIGADGSTSGSGCTDPDGTCFSVYHSCTRPLKINGTIPRSDYTCPAAQPFDWPTVWIGDNGAPVDASILGVYRREASTWDKISNLLVHDSVPDRYRDDVGGLCSTSIDESAISLTASPTENPSAEPSTENSRTEPSSAAPTRSSIVQGKDTEYSISSPNNSISSPPPRPLAVMVQEEGPSTGKRTSFRTIRPSENSTRIQCWWTCRIRRGSRVHILALLLWKRLWLKIELKRSICRRRQRRQRFAHTLISAVIALVSAFVLTMPLSF
jgi:hypothetical protein